jgi:glycosyltransferase involved in cell wall biosynthesis
MEPKQESPIRVLYSFPHKLGANRICLAAWQHIQAMSNAGVEVIAFPGVLHKPVNDQVTVKPTLSIGKLCLPYKLLGTYRSCLLHDAIVAKRLRKMRHKIDLIHSFPLGSLKTLKVAKELKIPTILERCNAHTEFAYKVVREECEKLGVSMPEGHEHDYNEKILNREEQEYAAADYIFCPSEFVKGTFLERGFPPGKLLRSQYGYDDKVTYPPSQPKESKDGMTVLFAAGCAPRKGLHYALEAWLRSSAHEKGTFLVVGDFIPGYAEKLGKMLSHPSVKVLGYRKDLPDIMRESDVFVLPSIEEGSALVTYEARGSGCVLLSSDATGAVCEHMDNALVHRAGDIDTLSQHFSMLHEDRALFDRLRASSLKTANELTWEVAGRKMAETYKSVLQAK